MRKKFQTVVFVFMLAFVTVACSAKSKEDVELGQYTGMEIEYTDTTAELDELSVYSACYEGMSSDVFAVSNQNYRAKQYDMVNLDYEGSHDGEKIENGTAMGTNLVLGKESVIDGFDEQIIGSKVGDTLKFTIAFPNEYSRDTKLAGEEIVYTVTINYIVSIKNMKDNVVAENMTAQGYTTVQEMLEGEKEKLKTENESVIQRNKEEAVWKKVCENVKVNHYPEEEIEAAKKVMDDYYEKCAQDYGLELGEFLEQTGSSEEEYESYKKTEAENQVRSQLAAKKIAEMENIKVSNAEYEAKVEEYGFLEEDMNEEEIKMELLLALVKQFCVENNTCLPEN